MERLIDNRNDLRLRSGTIHIVIPAEAGIQIAMNQPLQQDKKLWSWFGILSAALAIISFLGIFYVSIGTSTVIAGISAIGFLLGITGLIKNRGRDLIAFFGIFIYIIIFIILLRGR